MPDFEANLRDAGPRGGDGHFLQAPRSEEDGRCGCPQCAAAEGREAAILPSDGVAANGKTIFDWDEAAAQLTRSGHTWSSALGQGVAITYAFRSTAGTMPDGVSGFQRFTEAQILAAEQSLALWADVANITFIRVGTGSAGDDAYSDSATILFANYTTETDSAAAFAFLPSPGATGSGNAAGDIWVDFSESQNANPVYGEFGPHTLAHEIGHAIGLRHPGNYNGQSPTYATDALYWQDSRMFTIMSYFGSTNVGGNLPAFSWGPQLHDIAAAQRLYGANLATRAGDTWYGFNANAGRPLFAIGSSTQGAVFSIWDGGGIDTLDLSGYGENADIDLRPESFTSAGPTPDNGPARYNISIARGVVIENARGGSGADSITGNEAANELLGNTGNDTIFGGAGADILAGQHGDDSLSGDAGDDRFWGGDGRDSLIGGAGADVLLGEGDNDFLDGGDGDDIIAGQHGDDGLLGGAGNDRFWGGDGADGINGDDGDDELLGEGGNDTLQGNGGADVIAGQHGDDRIFGGADADRIWGGDGADQINGDDGDDILLGEGDNDILVGNHGNDVLAGQHGDDTLWGSFGFDRFWGGDGADLIYGEWDNDELLGEGGDDRLYGGPGDDVVAGQHGDDYHVGGDGDDRFWGGEGADTLYGEYGADFILGEEGDDVLGGGPDADVLAGQGGADRLSGNTGADRLYGGDGADLFIFESGGGADIVHDFEDGLDLIDLRPYAGATFANTTIAASGAGDTLVTFVNGETALLVSIPPALVTAADFLFA